MPSDETLLSRSGPGPDFFTEPDSIPEAPEPVFSVSTLSPQFFADTISDQLSEKQRKKLSYLIGYGANTNTLVNIFQRDVNLPEKEVVFPLNGINFHPIKATEHFYINDINQKYTLLDIMEMAYPNECKSLYRHINPPESVFQFGPTTRMKIFRAAQLHHTPPTISPGSLELIPIFEYMSYELEGRFQIQSQYNAARFATNYTDDAIAAALCLQWGPISKHANNITDGCIYEMFIQPDGVRISIDFNHHFQERLNAGCDEAIRLNSMGNTHYNELVSQVMLYFFTYHSTSTSLPKKYIENVQHLAADFVRALLKPGTELPKYPLLEDPTTMIPNQELFLPYADFTFGNSTTKKKTMTNLAEANIITPLLERILQLGPLSKDRVYTTKELDSVGIKPNTRTKAKERNILNSSRRSVYTLNIDKLIQGGHI